MRRKKTYHFVLAIIISILLLSCASSSKTTYSEQNIDELHSLVEGKKFEIESTWAYPLASFGLNNLYNAGLFPIGSNSNQINLIGNPNFLKIEGDSIKAHLPYFGDRQLSANYNSQDIGIELDGLMEDLKVDFNEKKKRYELRFQASHDIETYQVAINIFPNKQTQMNINSTHRTNIAYRGDIKAVE
ncbi:hypothetical protein MTsPCn9_06480 [Croceitalea sp. MTPC9]|uniref:DUF4251 domain-containing protein n=1 Tax=unclassified Croceitalea TaxID=2632280 RepID=UPI002B3D248B|nr:hypothetical protein MTsPCn6_02230 [Croceitalea sp. MTPC6]GMN15712.1 hypothetical protein MTsPCn9_06480 [Croceitalea sp. MTPC9]